MMTIEEIKSALREEDGWFEPEMESNQYIYDIQLTRFAQIVVRVCTGISKTGNRNKPLKVFAVNLRTKRGWITSNNYDTDNFNSDHLLEECRRMWKQACARALKDKEPMFTKEKWDQKMNGS